MYQKVLWLSEVLGVKGEQVTTNTTTAKRNWSTSESDIISYLIYTGYLRRFSHSESPQGVTS